MLSLAFSTSHANMHTHTNTHIFATPDANVLPDKMTLILVPLSLPQLQLPRPKTVALRFVVREWVSERVCLYVSARARERCSARGITRQGDCVVLPPSALSLFNCVSKTPRLPCVSLLSLSPCLSLLSLSLICRVVLALVSPDFVRDPVCVCVCVCVHQSRRIVCTSFLQIPQLD